MSDKVSVLYALLGEDVTTSDILYIVDVSSGTLGSKGITVGQFIQAMEALWPSAIDTDSTALTDATPVVIASIPTADYDGFKVLVVLTDGTDKEFWTLDGVILAASAPFTQTGGPGYSARGHVFATAINGSDAEVSCTADGSGWTAKTALIRVPN